ncbi:MAG: patatin-like phospholipase family protein [Oscillospiraceae bacterium]
MELKLDRNKTYGLALEGGGAKGAYQIGAWKALREAGIHFSAVSGTSVGALNGAMIVMDDLERPKTSGTTSTFPRSWTWMTRKCAGS